MVYCRFYMNRKGLCSINMVDAEFEYTYEYQGNAAKLVHTPLTDKCYLTLTQGQRPEYPGLFCCTCTYSENCNHAYSYLEDIVCSVLSQETLFQSKVHI